MLFSSNGWATSIYHVSTSVERQFKGCGQALGGVVAKFSHALCVRAPSYHKLGSATGSMSLMRWGFHTWEHIQEEVAWLGICGARGGPQWVTKQRIDDRVGLELFLLYEQSHWVDQLRSSVIFTPRYLKLSQELHCHCHQNPGRFANKWWAWLEIQELIILSAFSDFPQTLAPLKTITPVRDWKLSPCQSIC